VAGVGWRPFVAAVVLGTPAAVAARSPVEAVVTAAFFGSFGFIAGLQWGHLPPSLRTELPDREQRREARRCVREGVAPDDPRLASAVVACAAPICEPVPGEHFMERVLLGWAVVLPVVAVVDAFVDGARTAVLAAALTLMALIGAWGVHHRRTVERPHAMAASAAATAMLRRSTG
jgi:hypothetical protein